jgi:hypothetical protein
VQAQLLTNSFCECIFIPVRNLNYAREFGETTSRGGDHGYIHSDRIQQ